MAMSFDALLRIKADVQGEGAVQGLAAKLGGLNASAAKASSGFKGLAGSVGGLVPGLQALIPMATGAGLTALAASAINAADNMNDMRQKTGVSVERLSQLQQAAEKSGTTIEGVSAALVKYNRGIVDGKAGEALKDLNISATDATGAMKSADQVLLEVADRFAAMPDGAAKTAAAIKLFGRAGADMIPMLNGGSESIKGMAVTMTGEFAGAADQFNDKMVDLRTGLGRIGVQLGTALMPLLLATTDAITGLVGVFSALPGPMQTAVAATAALAVGLLALAPAISAVISIAGAFAGLQIGATIAGWAGAIGPAVAAISAAFTGLLAFLTGTVGPALLAFFSGPVGWTVLAVAAVVAMAVAFREPIMGFLSWLGGTLNTLLVQPWLNLWNNVLRAPVTAIWEWMKGVFTTAFTALYAIAYQVWVQPWINLWNAVLREPVTAAWEWMKGVFTAMGEGFNTYVASPIRSAWTAVMQFIPNALTAVGNTIRGVWDGIINGIRGAFNGFLQGIANGINSVARGINGLIEQFNRLPGPDISFVPQISVPQFASGGYVTGRTLAEIGEAGPEYVVPQAKAMSFANNIIAGRTGEQALKSWTDQMSIGRLAPKGGFTNTQQKLAALRQQGIDATFSPLTGLVVRRRAPLRLSGGRGSAAFGNPLSGMNSTQVKSLGRVEVKQNLKIDRVERRSDGDYVTLDAAEQLAAKASSDAVNQVVRLLQQPSFRREVGIA